MSDIFYNIWTERDDNDHYLIPEEYFKIVKATLDEYDLVQVGYNRDLKELSEEERISALCNIRAIAKVKAEYHENNRNDPDN